MPLLLVHRVSKRLMAGLVLVGLISGRNAAFCSRRQISWQVAEEKPWGRLGRGRAVGIRLWFREVDSAVQQGAVDDASYRNYSAGHLDLLYHMLTGLLLGLSYGLGEGLKIRDLNHHVKLSCAQQPN